MAYLKRSLERKFTHMDRFFKVLLVTGARQVGKTTMLRHLASDQDRTYVTLDDLMVRNLAKTDPILFFQTYKPPIIIDEVQYAPELFSQIKLLCDASEETGLFWLTGSQHFEMMKNIQETLAGRVGILELYPLSKNEKNGIFFENNLDFSLSCLQERQKKTSKNDVIDIFEHIWCGGMPQVMYADAEQRHAYYSAYINTYIMRDVAELGGVRDTLSFNRFLAACAALISEQINYKKLADIVEISQPTAKEWLKLLEGMGIIYLLKPYANNALKRLTKTPKLYFYDTGLAAYLSMWLTQETLLNGAASGHYFENFVVIQILKNYAYSKQKVNMMYYRDANGKEIDVLIENGQQIHPLEIKKAANPDTRAIKSFNVLEKAMLTQGSGGIVCMCEEVLPIDEHNCFIPCNLI